MLGLRNPYEVGECHYDIGNDLYEAILGPSMAYTCGYWTNANTLDEAQWAKYELIFKKLGLRPGMTLLDLGCGFGGFLKYAAERGVHGTGVTVSKEQAAHGMKACAGLPVSIYLDDYKNVQERYDRVVSIGIMEHVRPKHYCTFLG